MQTTRTHSMQSAAQPEVCTAAVGQRQRAHLCDPSATMLPPPVATGSPAQAATFAATYAPAGGGGAAGGAGAGSAADCSCGRGASPASAACAQKWPDKYKLIDEIKHGVTVSLAIWFTRVVSKWLRQQIRCSGDIRSTLPSTSGCYQICAGAHLEEHDHMTAHETQCCEPEHVLGLGAGRWALGAL